MQNIFRALRFIPGYKRLLISAAVVGIAGAALVTAIPLAIQRVIDILFESVQDGSVSWAAVAVPIGIWLGLRLILMGVDWLREIVEDNIFLEGITSFRTSITRKLNYLSINYFEKHRAGKIAAQVNQSPFTFAGWLSDAIDSYMAVILNAVLGLAVLTYKFPPMALVVLVIAAVYSGYIFATMRTNRKYFKKHRQMINDYTGTQVENISFIAHIRALGVEKQRSKLFEDDVAAHRKSAAEMFRFQHRRNFVASFIDLLLYAVPLVIFTARVVNGQQSPTDIYILSVYLGRVSDASSRLARIWSRTIEVNDTVGETLEVLENTDIVTDPDMPEKLEDISTIRFDDVSFRYEDTTSDAVTGLTMEITKGQTVALVGRSGSGKSTVTKLMLRFYDPTEGTVSINGIDAKNYRQEDLRHSFCVVMQDVALFNDTVANNIAIAKPDATRADIEKAARVAHAHEFITALPDGYDTLVGERGVKLSGGEKQRVSIARAVLRDPEVILLDEATSALDGESEKYVQDGLKKLLKGRTAVIIAHRLSTVAHADKIVVLDKGKIVEEGSFAKLKKNDGPFAALLAHQQL